MLKAFARSRFAGHVFSSKSRPIAAAGLLPHLRPRSQARWPSQKRTYSASPTESRTSGADVSEVPPVNEDARLTSHLNRVFQPLQFPPELAARILTHTSYRDWRVSHNARLSFIGRRVLNSYLLMFLHSSPALNADHHFDLILERTLETHALGQFVAPQWGLGRVMRFTPVQSTEGETPRIGLYKITGTTVEAVMGGIYHQFGGTVAHRVFHTRLLPHLLLPGRPEGLHDAFHADANKICQDMGGPAGNLLVPASSSIKIRQSR